MGRGGMRCPASCSEAFPKQCGNVPPKAFFFSQARNFSGQSQFWPRGQTYVGGLYHPTCPRDATPRRAVRVSPVEFSHQPTAIMSASLACKAALLTSRLVVGKAPGRSARRSSTICAAASGDEQQLSRALRTVNTGALMQAGTKAEAKNTTFKTDTKKESKEVAAASSEASAPPSSASVGKIEYILKGPAPQKFGVADGELGNVLTASGSFVTRAVSGALCEGWNVSIQEGECPKDTYTFGEFNGRYVRETSEVANYKRPAQPIQIYEFEGCPFCKKVREAVIWLDLDVLFYPCPQGGPTFREQVKNEGGRDRPTFPYMVDPNTETKVRFFFFIP